jgi:pimeloyl-ACP methyl ester carboxylesterase
VASALVLAGGYAGWKGSLPPQVCAQRLTSCLAQSEMRPEDFVPDWIPELVTSAAPAELVDEITTIMSDFHPRGFRAMARAVAEADLRPALPTIDVPVLLLYGDDDKRGTCRHGRSGARRGDSALATRCPSGCGPLVQPGGAGDVRQRNPFIRRREHLTDFLRLTFRPPRRSPHGSRGP